MKRQLCWFGHMQRMEDSRKAKQELHWVPVEKRNRGRPHITRKDTVWRVESHRTDGHGMGCRLSQGQGSRQR